MGLAKDGAEMEEGTLEIGMGKSWPWQTESCGFFSALEKSAAKIV
jgi:hypothetical protein